MTISSETSDAPVDVGDGGQGLAKGSISLAGCRRSRNSPGVAVT